MENYIFWYFIVHLFLSVSGIVIIGFIGYANYQQAIRKGNELMELYKKNNNGVRDELRLKLTQD